LYKTKGGEGYIRAFSESPGSFTSEFAKPEKVLKALHVQNLQIWPRFRNAVQDDFENKAPQVGFSSDIVPKALLL
jgi:DNA excision repair protein ERCC-4